MEEVFPESLIVLPYLMELKQRSIVLLIQNDAMFVDQMVTKFLLNIFVGLILMLDHWCLLNLEILPPIPWFCVWYCNISLEAENKCCDTLHKRVKTSGKSTTVRHKMLWWNENFIKCILELSNQGEMWFSPPFFLSSSIHTSDHPPSTKDVVGGGMKIAWILKCASHQG